MKNKTGLLVAALMCLIAAGCGTVTQTLYLQNVEVNGPVNQPPLHITDHQKSGTVTLSAGFNFNTNKQVTGRVEKHSPVNKNGYYQFDTVTSGNTRSYYQSAGNVYNFAGSNLQWDIPDLTVNINGDFAVSNHLALSLGLNYSVQNQSSLWGGNAGLGIYSKSAGGAFRFDAGVLWQTMQYNASTVVVTVEKLFSGPADTSISFFLDRNTNTGFNPYIMFTYNSTYSGSPVNFFLNLEYFSQTILDFKPSSPNPDFYPFGISVIRNDQRGEATAVFLSGAAGLYINLNENTRLNLGARVLRETQIENSSASLFVMPVFQIDMRL